LFQLSSFFSPENEITARFRKRSLQLSRPRRRVFYYLRDRELRVNPSFAQSASAKGRARSRVGVLIPQDCLLARDLIGFSFPRGRLERRQETTRILANCTSELQDRAVPPPPLVSLVSEIASYWTELPSDGVKSNLVLGVISVNQLELRGGCVSISILVVFEIFVLVERLRGCPRGRERDVRSFRRSTARKTGNGESPLLILRPIMSRHRVVPLLRDVSRSAIPSGSATDSSVRLFQSFL